MKAYLVVILACMSMLTMIPRASAAETDQYAHREQPLRDSRLLLNEHVNSTLRKAIAEWADEYGPLQTHAPTERDRFSLAHKIRWSVEGALACGRFYQWVKSNPGVDKIMAWDETIYRRVPIHSSSIRLTHVLSPTVLVNGVRLGVDKFSHMFSMGWMYYKNYVRHGEEEMFRRGQTSEDRLFGANTTGVISHADLVANYEGYRFYRHLFDSDELVDKLPLIGWRDGLPFLRREFDFADYVTAYWDEAVNTSFYEPRVLPHVLPELRALCPRYHAAPELWTLEPAVERELQRRYERLKLGDVHRYRLDAVCAVAIDSGSGYR